MKRVRRVGSHRKQRAVTAATTIAARQVAPPTARSGETAPTVAPYYSGAQGVTPAAPVVSLSPSITRNDLTAGLFSLNSKVLSSSLASKSGS